VTGALLQLKKHVHWIQPPEQARSGVSPQLEPRRILEICSSLSEAKISGWEDVARIDIRPSKGLVKVTSVSNWEVQLDAANGEILSSASRRSDLIEALHDGSWFGDLAKYGIFFPAGVMLSLGAIAGAYLFLLPWFRGVTRRRNKRVAPITQSSHQA
jgi:uncharacterized iron-regulated membrane protein